MARDGFPDDPDNYSDGGYPEAEPTQYANYGGTGGEAYSEYEQTGSGTYPGQYPHPQPQDPWYRGPAALVGLGVLTAVLLALLIYAVVKFAGGESSGPVGTTTTSPTASSLTETSPTAATETTSASLAPAPGPATETVTETPATTTGVPATTTETPPPTTTTTVPPSTSTSTTVSTSVSTVTETVTTTQRVLPTIPTLFPRPGQ